MAKKPSALSKLNNVGASASVPPVEEYELPSAPNSEQNEMPGVSAPPQKKTKPRRKKKKTALDKLGTQLLPTDELTGQSQFSTTPFPVPNITNPEETAAEPFVDASNFATDSPNADMDIPHVFSQPPANNDAEELHEETSSAPNINYSEYEAQLDAEDMLRRRKERRSSARKATLEKIGIIAMTIACVYLVFLIYGALKTEYVYNEDGRVVAQRLTYEELENLETFNDVQSEYLQARRLYETILKLDYKMAAGMEDPLLIAPEYEAVLEQIDELVIQIKALDVNDPKYNQLCTMLEAWVGTDAALYCQKMSAAISRNDAQAASDALVCRNAMYNDFTIITENIVVLGSGVHGVDLSELEGWTPEKYINDNIDGMGGAN